MTDSTPNPESGDRVTDLISQPERADLGFEPDVPAVEDAAELIAGIANSGGGTIVLGVEGQGQVSGLDDPDSARTVISKAADSIVPPVSLEFVAETVGDEKVGVVTIPAGEGPSLPPKGPMARRDESGQVQALTKGEINDALPKVSPEEIIAQLVDQVAGLNKSLAEFKEMAKKAFADAKYARSWKGQAPGVVLGAALGAALGAIATVIIG